MALVVCTVGIPTTTNPEQEQQLVLAAVDADLEEFAHWVETELSVPFQSPLHPSERAILKTYLVRKLLPTLVPQVG